ncbi:sugar ABC transporter substrate-binding protein [Alkalihalobacillus oceani]|uniref:Sugar ABC transporter substrate-binding protein n=1 Tax=Halalkalibacter oceani TaxID=1653776 RepID=A0A9X2DM51_9BACI|nr:sugar ABC transporter substrate-binding protein [Halalkalibacter oceani]MCM3712500.1 sugar ABC transporter substrate-binding protein [Halalkalibacter oceani]
MSNLMSRREFLKRTAQWSAFGTGALMGTHLLSACSFSAKHEPVLEGRGQVVYANKSLGYYFFIIQQEAMHREVEARGFEFMATISNFNAERQALQVRRAAMKKPAALICDPVDSNEEFIQVIEEVRKQGIPVGVIDTPLNEGDVSITVAFDNYKGGVMAAEKVVRLLIEKYGSPRGVVLNCYGSLSSLAWKLRKEGFEKTLQQYRHIELISKATEGDVTKMYEVTEETLWEYPNLDAVHAASETPARGIYEALKSRKRLYPAGSAEHVIFVTIDGEPIAHEWIKEGSLDASISQDPIAYAEICVELLDTYTIQNKPIPFKTYSNDRYYWQEAELRPTIAGPQLVIPPFEVNQSNVNDKRHWANIALKEWGIKYV